MTLKNRGGASVVRNLISSSSSSTSWATKLTLKLVSPTLPAVGFALSPAVGALFFTRCGSVLSVLLRLLSLELHSLLLCVRPARGLRVRSSARLARDRVWQPSFVKPVQRDNTHSRRRALSAPPVRLHVVERSLWLLCLGCASRRSYRVGLVVRSTLLRASVSKVSRPCHASV